MGEVFLGREAMGDGLPRHELRILLLLLHHLLSLALFSWGEESW